MRAQRMPASYRPLSLSTGCVIGPTAMREHTGYLESACNRKARKCMGGRWYGEGRAYWCTRSWCGATPSAAFFRTWLGFLARRRRLARLLDRQKGASRQLWERPLAKLQAPHERELGSCAGFWRFWLYGHEVCSVCSRDVREDVGGNAEDRGSGRPSS